MIVIGHIKPELLSRAMDMYHFTQMEFALRMNVSESLISLWRTGKRDVPDDRARVMAQQLGVSIQSLIGISDQVQLDQDALERGYLKYEIPSEPIIEPVPTTEQDLPVPVHQSSRMKMQFGMDGMPMTGPGSKTLCSCGKTIR